MRTRIAKIIAWSIPRLLMEQKHIKAWKAIDNLPEKDWKKVCFKTADYIIDNITYSSNNKVRKELHKWMRRLK